MHYLIADTINGVTVSEPFSDDYDVLGNSDFYDALPFCKENEILRGIVDHETFLLILIDYGIGGRK
jgi:hypothetical protein